MCGSNFISVGISSPWATSFEISVTLKSRTRMVMANEKIPSVRASIREVGMPKSRWTAILAVLQDRAGAGRSCQHLIPGQPTGGKARLGLFPLGQPQVHLVR